MNKYIGFIAIVAFMGASCQQNEKVNPPKKVMEEVVETVYEKEGIRLSTNSLASNFDQAQLNLIAPDNHLLNAGEQIFRFEVQNFELGANTVDVLSGQCANSNKGQHIHFIMDNEPYSAHYEAEFKQNMTEGHHVLLAFLSRSYHMSVKNKSAYVLKEYTVGEAVDNFDENAPHLFYSRPKGDYIGAEAKKILLDFYLLNTNLEEEHYSVSAIINGIEFKLAKWEPFFIEGLPNGANTIQLILKNKEGNVVKSPFNSIERTINVKYNEESI